MKEEDEEHTSFITPYGVFCYRTMPFGLKNAGATYQRMMQACLKEQIGRNVQVYMGDIVIKTYNANTLLDNLRETFAALNKYRIKLNPKKCAFGVPARKLLGYMVSARGIETNPEKVQAIAKMQRPTNIRGVQQLTGKLAALSRFISRLGERTLPFYKLLRKGEKFEWTEEARNAFADLKKTLSTPPILAVPKEREKLYLYIAARSSVVSAVLVVERAEEGKVQSIQRPIYYLSMLLTKSQERYPHYQKILLAIVMTSRKVSHYFDEHSITIVNSAPLADILNNPGATSRVAEWNIELSPRDLQFKHPTTIKAQVLLDFLVEWTEVQTPGSPDLSNSWKMFFDGSKIPQGAGAGVALDSPKGTKLRYVLQINFSHASNNEAEYEALLHDMRMAKTCGATRLVINGDSNLVVQQAMRDCDAIADNMAAYQKLYNTLDGSFYGCELNYISRANNTEADELANIGSTRGPVPPGVFLKSISQRSIKIKPAAPEAVAEDNDTREPAQAAAANPADDTSSQVVEIAELTALEGPA